jgi:hypothetical protein
MSYINNLSKEYILLLFETFLRLENKLRHHLLLDNNILYHLLDPYRQSTETALYKMLLDDLLRMEKS